MDGSGSAGSRHGFEAHARILHPVPATLEDLSVTDEWGMHPVPQQAFEVDEDADLTYEGDTINPPRDG